MKTSAYVSLGRGGGTGPRGRINGPNTDRFFRGRIFDSFSGLGIGTHDANGQVRWDDIIRFNQGAFIEDDWGQKEANEDGQYAGQFTSTSSGNGFIRRASMNSHNWFGVLSTLTTKLDSDWNIVAGLDARRYKGIHYRRLENLLGNAAYLSRADDNNPTNLINNESPADFGNFSDPSYKNENNVLNYWNDGLVNWIGLFTQLEYATPTLSAFVSLSGSNQGFKRIDYFNYLDNDPQRESDWENFLGGTVKAGANYNIDEQHNVFLNGGYYSKQPIFDNVFINFVNEVNENVKNQSVTAIEMGYGYRSKSFNTKVNLYSTVWGNRQFDRSIENANDEDVLFQFEGVSQSHIGLELEADYRVSRALGFTGMLSIGDWKYKNNFTARGQNIDTQQPEGEATFYAEGLKVGDAAQTTFSIGLNAELTRGLRFYADYYLADNLYADYDLLDAQFYSPGGKVVKLPAYSLVDAGLSYGFTLGETDASLRFNMNNVLDTEYVSELETNIIDDPSTSKDEFYNNRGIWGFGRTWNAGLKIFF